MIEIVSTLLVVSIATNAFLLYRLIKRPTWHDISRLNTQKAALEVELGEAKKTKKTLNIDAQALLQDLLNGPALIKVEYLDRSDVFLRSPRDHM